MSMRLGSLELDESGVVIEAAEGRSGRLDRYGVAVDVGSGPVHYAWGELVEFEVNAPTINAWWYKPIWWLFAIFSYGEPRAMTVEVSGQPWATDGFLYNLGKPSNAPYDYRDADALDALVSRLNAAMQVSKLGDVNWLRSVIPSILEARSWLPLRTRWRVDRVVRKALPSSTTTRPG